MELQYAASQGPLRSATWTSQDTTVHHCGKAASNMAQYSHFRRTGTNLKTAG